MFSRLRSIALLFFTLLSCGNILSAAEINIKSASLEYDQESKYVVAEGSVTVLWQDKTLNADKVEFWTDKEFLMAKGTVTFTDNKNIIFCESLAYDYKSHTAETDKVSGSFTPWYFAARKMDKKDEKRYEMKNMRMTTCDNSTPHYTIRASRATIITGKRITVYNPVFYIRKVPIFYLPIFSQPIGGNRYSLEIEPGYNNNDGVIVKTTLGFPVSKYSYGKLYLDYFEKRGWGEGAEYDYNNPGKLLATVYGYHLKEEYSTGNEFTNFKVSHWQKINNEWTSRSNINFANSQTFNTQYFQDNWALQNREIDSSLAFTRQTRKSTLQISMNRTDISTDTTGAFQTASMTLPQVSYTRYSLLNNSPYNSTLNITYQNSYNPADSSYEELAFTKVDIKRSYSFFKKKLSITPLLALSENWDDALDVNNSSFTTRYISSVNARYYITRSMSWDLGYNYTLRSAVNNLGVDSDAPDYGEELNQIYAQNLFYYGRVTIRNSTSYSLARNRGEIVDDWREKFAPLVNEFTWAPKRSLSLYVKETNNIYLTMLDPIDSNYLRSVQSIVTIGQMDEQYVSLGAFYQADQPDNLGFNVSFGYRPNAKWKIDYRLVAEALDRFNSVTFNDQQITIYRNLHCWECKVTYRRMLNNEEVYFQINLTSSSKARKKLYNQSFEKEFYPWR